MKSSPLAPLLLAALAFAGGNWVPQVVAQDAVILNNGLTREGQIVGVSGNNVQLRINNATAGIPLGDIREIRMQAPREFDEAATQLASGDATGAVAALQQLNNTFAGLPAEWARRAAALLGDAKLAAGDTEGAEAAYERFRQTYPDATALANLGMARLAVDGGRYNEAAPLLDDILEQSSTTVFAAPAESAALAQAHYLKGRILEASGDHQAALENYLKAGVLFPGDRNAASAAQARADSLRAAHAGLIAP